MPEARTGHGARHRRVGARHALRVVRLLPVRRARRLHRVPFLLGHRPDRRLHPGARDLRGRLHRAPARGTRVRPHRRPGGSQEHVPGHARDHGPRDRPGRRAAGPRRKSASRRRSCSSCCGYSRGSRSAASSAAPSSTSPNMPRPGAAGCTRAGSRAWRWRAAAVARGHRGGALGDAVRGVRGVGLARAVPAFGRAARHLAVDPDSAAGEPGLPPHEGGAGPVACAAVGGVPARAEREADAGRVVRRRRRPGRHLLHGDVLRVLLPRAHRARRRRHRHGPHGHRHRDRRSARARLPAG